VPKTCSMDDARTGSHAAVPELRKRSLATRFEEFSPPDYRSISIPVAPPTHLLGETRAMAYVIEAAIAIQFLSDAVKVEQTKRAEQELLLQELDHRFKNMFAMLVGLIRYQLYDVIDPNARSVLMVAIARVQALGLAHKVCSHTHSGDLTEVVTSVCTNLVTSDPRFELDVEAAKVSVPVPTANLVALIANELVTNAMKHSISDRASGRIHVSLQPLDESRLVLSVTDDGEPLTGEVRAHTKGSGLNLIARLVAQLSGEFRVETAPKRFSVVFPAQFAVYS